MLSVVISAQNCWLLNQAPNTADAVRLSAALPAEVQRSLTGVTTRRPEAFALRYALEWSSDLLAADFALLRNATQAAQDEPVVVPVWPYARRVADAAVMDAGLVVAWTEDWLLYEINPASLAGYDYVAPLLYGRLTQAPRLGAKNDELVTAEFSVEEDAPVGFSFSPSTGVLAADTTFNTALGYTAPVFPFLPDRQPEPGVAITAVDRQRTGPGRRKASIFYPQIPEQTLKAGFKLSSATEAARLLAWWARRAGVADAHWVPGSQAIGRLSAVAAAGTNVLNFAEPINLGSNVYVSLFGPDGTLELGRVTASTAQQLTLAANLAHTWGPSLAVVTLAMLARHTDTELAIDFERAGEDWIATSELAWREVGAEYSPSEIETRGTTLGRLPGTAWFFQLDLDYNGALRSWYLTNHESGAVANLITWEHNACDFDSLRQSVDLEDDSCTVDFRYFAGGPWDNWLPGNLAARGYLTISRANVSSEGVISGFAQVWKGELKTPSLDGPLVSQKAIGANALFARSAPVQVMSKTCGTRLFKQRCGLALADWTFNAVITAVAGNIVTVGTITRANGGGLPDGFGAENWFALGWLGWLVGGVPYRNGVLGSAAIGGGTIVLTLEIGCTLAVASAVTLVPGCDRQGSTCRDKFANYDNFRGFEFMPAVSPSLVVPQRNTSGGKK